jgi:4-aminobutyrate aminotransferase-like enzyme
VDRFCRRYWGGERRSLPGVCGPAIQDQAAKYIHTSFNVVTYEPYIELCEKLIEILPHGKKTKAMLVSTGAEAVENAIKIARQATNGRLLCVIPTLFTAGP